VMSMSGCLSVCLSVCRSVRSQISKTARPNFAKFSGTLTGRGSVLLWWHCDTLCISGFVDAVMFHAMRPSYVFLREQRNRGSNFGCCAQFCRTRVNLRSRWISTLSCTHSRTNSISHLAFYIY